MSKRRTTRKENYEKRKKKSRAKKILMIVCAFLAGLFVMGSVSALTAEKTLNPDNLIKVENYFDNLMSDSEKGLKVKWKDDGRFVLSGKHSDADIADNSLYTVAFTSVTLNPGVYTLSTGNDKCDDDTYGLYYIKNGESPVYVQEKTSISIDSITPVEIGFYVKNNYNIIYAEFAPVLVSGDKVGTFFVED